MPKTRGSFFSLGLRTIEWSVITLANPSQNPCTALLSPAKCAQICSDAISSRWVCFRSTGQADRYVRESGMVQHGRSKHTFSAMYEYADYCAPPQSCAMLAMVPVPTSNAGGIDGNWCRTLRLIHMQLKSTRQQVITHTAPLIPQACAPNVKEQYITAHLVETAPAVMLTCAGSR